MATTMTAADLIPLTPETTTSSITITPAAAEIVRTLLQDKKIPDYHLRVFVAGGGCSGLQYGMGFEASPRAGDAVFQVADGVKVLVDPQSAMYLDGASIDYVESLMGGGFRIENPNAVSSCGCGHSFRSKDTSSAASASAGGCGSGGCGCG